MDPRAYRVAQEFMAQEFLRRAKYKPEFLMWARGRKFRNPETGNEVQFESLPPVEQKRIYRQWAKDKGLPDEAADPRAQSRQEATRRNLEIAREGKVVRREPLSTGGQEAAQRGEGMNVSEIVVLEHNGDCYPCDFLVEPQWRLGNIHREPPLQMIEGEAFQRLRRSKSALHSQCEGCEWLSLCYGECPRYRIVGQGTAEHTLPYFCEAYRTFFEHNYERLERIAIQLGQGLGLNVPQEHLSPRARTGMPVVM